MLLHIKHKVKDFDSSLTRELLQLIEREADLINRYIADCVPLSKMKLPLSACCWLSIIHEAALRHVCLKVHLLKCTPQSGSASLQ